MADYAYTKVIGKLSDLLSKIREIGIPSKVNNPWLTTLGYTSTNDRSLLSILKFIGFTTDDGSPTELWTKYRGKNHKQVLAESIRQSYSDLFSLYPDAYKRSSTDLEHFFSTKTTSGKQVIQTILSTFQTLCENADFEQLEEYMKYNQTNTDPNKPSIPTPKIPTGQPSIHIDLQIHISSDASPEQIDKIFESMSKHLFKKN